MNPTCIGIGHVSASGIPKIFSLFSRFSMVSFPILFPFSLACVWLSRYKMGKRKQNVYLDCSTYAICTYFLYICITSIQTIKTRYLPIYYLGTRSSDSAFSISALFGLVLIEKLPKLSFRTLFQPKQRMLPPPSLFWTVLPWLLLGFCWPKKSAIWGPSIHIHTYLVNRFL